MFNNMDDHGLCEAGARRSQAEHDRESHWSTAVEHRGTGSVAANFTSACTRDRRTGCLLNNNRTSHARLSCPDIISNPSDADEYGSPVRVRRDGLSKPQGYTREKEQLQRRKGSKQESYLMSGATSRNAQDVRRLSDVRSPNGYTLNDMDIGRNCGACSVAASWESKYCPESPAAAATKYSTSSPSNNYEAYNSGPETDYEHLNGDYCANYLSNDVAANWSSDGEDLENYIPEEVNGGYPNTPADVQSPGMGGRSAGGALPDFRGKHSCSAPSKSLVGSGCGSMARSTVDAELCFSYNSNAVKQMGDTRRKAGHQGSGLDERVREDSFHVKTTTRENKKKHPHKRETKKAPKSPYGQQSVSDIFESRSGMVTPTQDRRRADDLLTSTSGYFMATRESFFATKDSIFGSMYDIVIPPSPLDIPDTQPEPPQEQQGVNTRLGCIPVKTHKKNPLRCFACGVPRDSPRSPHKVSLGPSRSSKKLMKTDTAGSEIAKTAAANARARDLYKSRHAVLLDRMEAALDEPQESRSFQSKRAKDARCRQGGRVSAGVGGNGVVWDTAFQTVVPENPHSGSLRKSASFY